MGSPRTPDTPSHSGGSTAHLYAKTGCQARGMLVPSRREAYVVHSDAMKQATTISTTLHISHNWTIHPQDSDKPQALPFEQAQGNPGLMPTMLAAQGGTHKGWQVVQSASRVTNNTGGLLAGAGGQRGRRHAAPFLPLRKPYRGARVQPGLFQLFLQSPCNRRQGWKCPSGWLPQK